MLLIDYPKGYHFYTGDAEAKQIMPHNNESEPVAKDKFVSKPLQP